MKYQLKLKKAAIGADGPAFYAARQMIDFLKEEEKHLRNQAPDIQVAFYNKESFIIDEINMMLTLTKIIEDNWTDKQRYTIWDMIARYDKITKDEKFAEYYLLGTLISTACVVACKMIVLR